MTYSDKSVVRQICRKIYSLLRLTDFRLRESLYECVENNLINFRSNLHRIRSENDNINPNTPLTEVGYNLYLFFSHIDNIQTIFSYTLHSKFQINYFISFFFLVSAFSVLTEFSDLPLIYLLPKIARPHRLRLLYTPRPM